MCTRNNTMPLEVLLQMTSPTSPWGVLMTLNPNRNHVDLLKDSYTLGRHSTCDVVFEDQTYISGLHCRILKDQQGIFLTDESSNGTYVNGERLEKGVPFKLSHRDEVSLALPSSLSAQTNTVCKKSFVAYIFQEMLEKHEDKQDVESSTPNKKRSATFQRMPSLKFELSNVLNPNLNSNLQAPSVIRAGNLLPPQKRTKVGGEAAPVLKFYEVDFASLEKIDGVKTHHFPTYSLLTLPRPHVADRSLAAEHFKIAELAFRRFVNRDRIFSVSSVDVIRNNNVEGRFKKKEASLQKDVQEDLRRSGEKWAGAEEKRIFEHLSETIFWCSERQVGDGSNPILAWHGTTPERLPEICSKGFLNLATKDSGWYGSGIYFTQMPNYGQFYINHCVSEMGESFTLILSWLLLGKPYPLTYKLEAGNCQDGFDSHVVLVDGFEPCPLDKPCTGDEIVIFEEAQALPRYIVHYEMIKKARFTPMALLSESSGDEEEEDTNSLQPPSDPTRKMDEGVTQVRESIELTEETKVIEGKCKAFVLNEATWDPVGEGFLQILVHNETSRSRLVFKEEATGKANVNFFLFNEMEITLPKEDLMRVVAFENNVARVYLFRFKQLNTSKVVSEHIQKYKPFYSLPQKSEGVRTEETKKEE
eukprot:TRINITY_DN4277_c0_g1_i2.p1 TRINITY_DN4277_c0_g1~~TRINITY_DN4277_c0_g1_i2.p1  ORF type:complete len:663 (-),score=150.87 TRINITY_DN4277_c0_g1_i2:3-1934(-)